MAVFHGTLSAGQEAEVELSTDQREAGVLHVSGTTPIYVRWYCEGDMDEDVYTIMPGMRRWIPAPCDAPFSTMYMKSDGACEWEIET